MELFKTTGRHPELEAQQQAATAVVPALPDVDLHRPYVFMDLQQSKRLLGARPTRPLVTQTPYIVLAAITTACQTCWRLVLSLYTLRSAQRLLAGRLVIEVFEELLPVEARHFITRCQQGSSDSFQGTQVHRLVQDLAAFGGQTKE